MFVAPTLQMYMTSLAFYYNNIPVQNSYHYRDHILFYKDTFRSFLENDSEQGV